LFVLSFHSLFFFFLVFLDVSLDINVNTLFGRKKNKNKKEESKEKKRKEKKRKGKKRKGKFSMKHICMICIHQLQSKSLLIISIHHASAHFYDLATTFFYYVLPAEREGKYENKESGIDRNGKKKRMKTRKETRREKDKSDSNISYIVCLFLGLLWTRTSPPKICSSHSADFY